MLTKTKKQITEIEQNLRERKGQEEIDKVSPIKNVEQFRPSDLTEGEQFQSLREENEENVAESHFSKLLYQNRSDVSFRL